MKRLYPILTMIAVLISAAVYGQGFTLDVRETSATITLDKARKQTLWLPIDNTAKEVTMRVEVSCAIVSSLFPLSSSYVWSSN